MSSLVLLPAMPLKATKPGRMGSFSDTLGNNICRPLALGSWLFGVPYSCLLVVRRALVGDILLVVFFPHALTGRPIPPAKASHNCITACAER